MFDETAARHYGRIKNRLRLIRAAVLCAGLFVIAYAFTHQLRRAAGGWTDNPVIIVSLYWFFLYAVYLAGMFPFAYYGEFLLKQRFELSGETFREWLGEKLKRELLRFTARLAAVQIIYGLLSAHYERWWIWLSAACAVWLALKKRIFPLAAAWILAGKPLEDTPWKESLLDKSRELGVKAGEILCVAAGNAPDKAEVFISGIHPRRSIVISDTLLTYDREEAEVFISREIIRFRYGYVWKEIAAHGARLTLVWFAVDAVFKPAVNAFGFRPLHDIITLPLFLLLGLSALGITAPFFNALMRRFQKETDELVLQLTKLPEAFLSVLIRFAARQMCDPAPHPLMEFLLYDHVPYRRRMQMAEDYAGELLLRQLSRKF